MFVELKNRGNSFCDDLPLTLDYMPESFDIAIAGIGKFGSIAVSDYNLSLNCLEYIDSLTMFDFNSGISSDNKAMCKNACRDSLWTFVLTDPAEEGSVESCIELVDSFRKDRVNKDGYIVCIILDRYRKTAYYGELKRIFDKIFYVEDASHIFVPIETLFLHPMGYTGGVDYGSYLYALEKSKNIYLLHIEALDKESVFRDLKKEMPHLLEENGINEFNTVYCVSHNDDIDTGLLYELCEADESFRLEDSRDGSMICNALIRKKDGIIINILICEVQ